MSRENLSESVEVYLGEVSFQLTNIKFLRLSGVYPLSISSSSINLNTISSLKASKILKSIKNNSNKIPKMVIQMGIFNDESSKIELQKIPVNNNIIFWIKYINIYIYIYIFI